MTNKLVIVFGLGFLTSALPLPCAEGPHEQGPKQSFAVSGVERVNFQPGGVIRIENSYGNLTVEGWDEPEVEVTITKSTDRYYEPGEKQKAGKSFDQIQVRTKRSDKELVISTTYPVHKTVFTPLRRALISRPDKLGITVDYKVLVPRDSRLVVHHDHGYVWVNDVTQDIDVDSHTGDMVVMLPESGPYSIDARTRTGSVSSDLTGKVINQFLVGSHFAYSSDAPSRRIIHLRMGCGSITIKSSPPSGPYGKN